METRMDRGFKLTPQRAAIMSFLDGNTSHPSAEDIYEAVVKDYPMVSLATVYNTIEVLKRLGRVIEISIDGKRKHFDPITEPHHHLICARCNKITDIRKDFDLCIPVELLNGFRIIRGHAEFHGVCPECIQKD
jgi:Fur family peroxide stress response transcriptional regulator